MDKTSVFAATSEKCFTVMCSKQVVLNHGGAVAFTPIYTKSKSKGNPPIRGHFADSTILPVYDDEKAASRGCKTPVLRSDKADTTRHPMQPPSRSPWPVFGVIQYIWARSHDNLVWSFVFWTRG